MENVKLNRSYTNWANSKIGTVPCPNHDLYVKLCNDIQRDVGEHLVPGSIVILLSFPELRYTPSTQTFVKTILN